MYIWDIVYNMSATMCIYLRLYNNIMYIRFHASSISILCVNHVRMPQYTYKIIMLIIIIRVIIIIRLYTYFLILYNVYVLQTVGTVAHEAHEDGSVSFSYFVVVIIVILYCQFDIFLFVINS